MRWGFCLEGLTVCGNVVPTQSGRSVQCPCRSPRPVNRWLGILPNKVIPECPFEECILQQYKYRQELYWSLCSRPTKLWLETQGDSSHCCRYAPLFCSLVYSSRQVSKYIGCIDLRVNLDSPERQTSRFQNMSAVWLLQEKSCSRRRDHCQRSRSISLSIRSEHNTHKEWSS